MCVCVAARRTHQAAPNVCVCTRSVSDLHKLTMCRVQACAGRLNSRDTMPSQTTCTFAHVSRATAVRDGQIKLTRPRKFQTWTGSQTNKAAGCTCDHSPVKIRHLSSCRNCGPHQCCIKQKVLHQPGSHAPGVAGLRHVLHQPDEIFVLVVRRQPRVASCVRCPILD